MKREWTDELGRTWKIELGSPDPSSGTAADAVLLFQGEGEEDRAMPMVGPAEELFDELDDAALAHALEATAVARGVLLIEQDGHLWWVRAPEEDMVNGGRAVFSDGTVEHRHRGPLPDEPEALGEDELLELLDEARGAVMEEMDVTVGGET